MQLAQYHPQSKRRLKRFKNQTTEALSEGQSSSTLPLVTENLEDGNTPQNRNQTFVDMMAKSKSSAIK